MSVRTARERAPPRRQGGIALLVAILLVALGTIIATAIAFDSTMTARRGIANLDFDQSIRVAEGAEALAAYGLREVRQSDSSRTIHPLQAWAQPVGPIEVFPGVMLDAQLEDLQGRFNLNWLVDRQTDAANPAAVLAFQRLLEMLDLEPKWALYMVDWIDYNTNPQPTEGAEDSVYLGQDPPYRTANLYITSPSELLALPGFGRERYQKLAPYVSALPPDTSLNVCTASALVLDAFMTQGRREFTDEASLAKNRQSANACFPTLQEFQQLVGSATTAQQARGIGGAGTPPAPSSTGAPGGPPGATGRPGTQAQVPFGQTSSYFRLASHVTLGTAEFNLYSLLWQDGNTGLVRPIQRTFIPD